MPSVGGEPDLAQYLQVIPGITFTGDQGGQIYIRGGAPIQNRVILDGLTIYNPFHSIGLFSVFDVDILRNVEVYTGGFGAKYGGRLSGIMDITTRDGNKQKFGGSISASPFIANLLLEGPIKKFEENKGGSSFLFSARHSYLNNTAPSIYQYAGARGLPYQFTDIYGKYSILAPGGTQLSFFGFNFNDKVDFTGLTNYGWNSYGVGSRLFLVPTALATTIEATLAYSIYSSAQEEADGLDRNSSISGLDAGLNFTYYFKEEQDQLWY